MQPFATPLCAVLKDTKIPNNIKKEVQAIGNVLEGEISMNVLELPEVPNLMVQTSAVSSL